MEPRKTTLCSRSALVGLLALLAFVSYEWSALVPKANAIPAFARKYNFACNTCHVPGFPKLNDFGNLFRDQGYQLGGDNDLPTYEGIGMGYWPVSIRTTVGYQVANTRVDGQAVASSGFGMTGLDILSFGTLHRNIAFGVVMTPGLSSSGFGTGSDSSDIEAAYVRLMNLERFLGGKNNTYWLNLKVGKFELDVPFSEKRSPTLNTPFAMYHYVPGTIYQGGALAGASGSLSGGYANANTFGIGDNQPGLELTGIAKTDVTGGYFRYSASMLTTNGGSFSDKNGGGAGRSVYFLGHVTQSFGGYGIVTGQRIGAFVVAGNAPTLCPAADPGTGNGTPAGGCGQAATGTQGKSFTRVGGEVSLTYDNQWNLFGAFMHAVDSNAMMSSQGVANAQNAAWNGGFVELDWYPTQLPIFHSPGWLFSYRYDIIRNQRQGDPTFAKTFNDVDSQTVMARYYIHQSARTDIAMHAEYNWYKDKGVGAGGGNLYGQTSLVGFDFAY